MFVHFYVGIVRTVFEWSNKNVPQKIIWLELAGLADWIGFDHLKRFYRKRSANANCGNIKEAASVQPPPALENLEFEPDLLPRG